MYDNKTTRWSEGLRFCLFQKNNELHSVIEQSPYEAIIGRKAKLGLASSCLPKSLVESLASEENLVCLLENEEEQISEEQEISEEEQIFEEQEISEEEQIS